MSNEDGGVGTVSSSVRRTRSSRGIFVPEPALDADAAGFLADRAFAVRALRATGLARRRPTTFAFDRADGLARFAARERLDCFRDVRGFARRAALRLAMSETPWQLYHGSPKGLSGNTQP